MNVDQMTATIVAAYPSRQPLFAWGAPGLGKSSGVREAARLLNDQLKSPKAKGTAKLQEFGIVDLRLATMDPVDLRGLPHVANGLTQWTRPSWLPQSGAGILFLDEFVQAPTSMGAAASQLILDRCIGEHKLGDGWMVVGAGNRLSDRAATSAMATHIANRFVHLNIDLSVDGWVKWALAHDVDVRLIAFIKWREKLLHAFDPAAKVQAFPSPRSWEFVSKLLSTAMPANLLPEVVKGAVGEGPASEFIAFLRVYEKMPSIDAILMNPTSSPIPTKPAVLYAVTTTLVNKAKDDNITRIAAYFNRLTAAGHPEFSVIAMKEIVAQQPKLGNTKAFIEWASKHNEVL